VNIRFQRADSVGLWRESSIPFQGARCDLDRFCKKRAVSARKFQTSRVTALLSLCWPRRLEWFSTVWMTLYYYCVPGTELSTEPRPGPTVRIKNIGPKARHSTS
jgi:hypothetical protein